MWGIFAHHVEAVQPEQSTAWKVSLLLDVFGPWSQALQLLRLSRLRLLQVVPYPSKMRKENWTQCGFLILVGGLEHVLFSIAHMGYHPSHWRAHIVQRGRAQAPDPIARSCQVLDLRRVTALARRWPSATSDPGLGLPGSQGRAPGDHLRNRRGKDGPAAAWISD